VDCVSITFERQKKKEKNNTVTQEATSNSVLCPVRFAGGIVRQIMSYPGTSLNTNISMYMSNGSVKHVTSRLVINTLRDAVEPLAKHAWESPRTKSAPTPSDRAPQWQCT
jgi:hypothetical protein